MFRSEERVVKLVAAVFNQQTRNQRLAFIVGCIGYVENKFFALAVRLVVHPTGIFVISKIQFNLAFEFQIGFQGRHKCISFKQDALCQFNRFGFRNLTSGNGVGFIGIHFHLFVCQRIDQSKLIKFNRDGVFQRIHVLIDTVAFKLVPVYDFDVGIFEDVVLVGSVHQNSRIFERLQIGTFRNDGDTAVGLDFSIGHMNVWNPAYGHLVGIDVIQTSVGIEVQ